MIKNTHQKLQINHHAEELSKQAYIMSLKRLELNTISITEFITLRNNYQKSQIERLITQYDLIFKQEILKMMRVL